MKLTHLIKLVAEVITAIAVASYAIGFIIVNTHLLTFGYSGATLFKVKYVSAGLLFLFITFIICICLYPLYWSNLESKKFPPRTKKSLRYGMLMGMAMALYLFSTLLNAIAGEAIKESFDFHPWWIELVVFGLLALLIIVDISNWKKGFAPKLQAYHGFSFLLLWIVITVSTYQLKALTFIPFLTLGIIMIFAVVNDERSISTQRWLRLVGQCRPFLKWRLADC